MTWGGMPNEVRLENFMTCLEKKSINHVTGNTLFKTNVSVNIFKVEIYI